MVDRWVDGYGARWLDEQMDRKEDGEVLMGEWIDREMEAWIKIWMDGQKTL